MNNFINFLNLILALAMVAFVIAFAAIVIPVALASVVGFILALWLYANLVDGALLLRHKVKRFFKRS